MKDKDFSEEIDRARTRLQADYRDVTVSATMWQKTVFVSVKTPYWTHEMEWREEDAPDMPLSEWIYREVRSTHAPDIAKVAHTGGDGETMSMQKQINKQAKAIQFLRDQNKRCNQECKDLQELVQALQCEMFQLMREVDIDSDDERWIPMQDRVAERKERN